MRCIGVGALCLFRNSRIIALPRAESANAFISIQQYHRRVNSNKSYVGNELMRSCDVCLCAVQQSRVHPRQEPNRRKSKCKHSPCTPNAFQLARCAFLQFIYTPRTRTAASQTARLLSSKTPNGIVSCTREFIRGAIQSGACWCIGDAWVFQNQKRSMHKSSKD